MSQLDPQPVQLLVRGLLLALGLTLLSGCISVDFGSDLRQDGSGTHWISVTYPKSEIAKPEFSGLTQTIDSIIAEAELAGLDVMVDEDSDLVTVSVSTVRQDSEDVGAALNSLLNATGINASPGIIAPFQGTFRQQSEAVGGTIYVLDLTVDGDVLLESLGPLGTGDFEVFPAETIRQQLDIEYSATLPGEITDTNGRQINQTTVLWKIPLAGTLEMQATSKVSESGSGLLFVITSLIFAAGTVIVAAVVGRVLVRRGRLSRRIRDAVPELPAGAKASIIGMWVSRKIEPLVTLIWRDAGATGPAPFSEELAGPAEEVDEHGAHTEGDRPAADLQRSRAGAKASGARTKVESPGSRRHHH